ncbi:MAG: DNA polymerase III subunit gamma/tau [Bacteroidales bacterium]|nr:DNA polymerase III subunit gamma/tau [Bacteroidales bacterium]
MDNFIVSARKYRPATFDTVVGQDHITTTLKNAIRNQQLAQAFLFTGPRGVGKTTCARIFAKTINCLNLDENIEPCNACDSCLSFNRSASFNIFELDAASNNSVEDIRSLVDQVRIPPQSVRYKVYIIDEVHMLSSQAFNAFLKTLEEPPEYAKFILATTEKHKIIPTILSRCQIYDFKRITVKDIARHLAFVASKEGVQAEEEALQVIAYKADGALRDALSIFDQLVSFAGKELHYELVVEHLNVLDYDYYFKVTDFLLQGNIFESLLTFNKVIESGFDGQHFISGLGAHLRDLLVCTDKKTIELLEVGEKIKERYLAQASKCSPTFLIKALDIIQKTDFGYKMSNSKRLHIEIALMQLASINDLDLANNRPLQAVAPPEKKTEVISAQLKPTQPPPPKPSLQAVTTNPAIAPEVPANPANQNKVNEPAKPTFIPSTISIKDDVSQTKDSPESEEIETFDFESEEFLNARKIQPEQLQQTWTEYANKIAPSHPNLYSTLIAAKPEISDDFEITFEVSNSLQQREIYAQKMDLITFLREELNNNFVRIKVNVNAIAVQVRPYKPEEVYQHFVEKNPVVGELKQKFGLTLEY